MKVESIQIPNVVAKTNNSQGILQGESFSKVLSHIMTDENDSTGETEEIQFEQPELNVEESDVEEANPLPVFFNMASYKSKEPSLQILDPDLSSNGTASEINIVETIIFVDGNIFQTDANMIQDQSDVFLSSEDMISTSENFIVENNMVMPQIPKKEPLSYIKEEFTPPQDDTVPDIDVKEDNLSNKKISLPEKAIRNQQDELIVERDKKTIEVNEEETLTTKNKDIGLQENKWINTNVREFERTNFNSKMSTQESVFSRENMMAVNDSIIELVETTGVGDSSIMKVRLYPEELGTVNVTLKMEEGKLVAKILVDSSYLKQLFTGKLNELNENLIKQNIHIEKVDIDLNTNLNQNLNSNSNSNSGEDFNKNSRKYFDRNKRNDFVEKPINKIIAGKVDVGLGEISILA